MPKPHDIEWYEVDKAVSGLETDVEHEIRVQREAIPLVFIPGIMGSRLRRAGTDGKGKGADGLPNLRWDPSDSFFMISNFVGVDGAQRRRLCIGTPEQNFDPGYLEVDNTKPVKDGFGGIMKDYLKFLNPLKKHDWGPLAKVFEFPVYAVGYNWTDSNENSGNMLLGRINEIIAEAKGVTGLCKKVILITHSMGGIVARAASELLQGRNIILGIIHGVQPVTGTPAAYWRMKAGFEGSDSLGIAQSALGNTGPKVTAILGNIPGGLELLPNKLHRDNSNRTAWIAIREGKNIVLSLPQQDPYQEIYGVKAVVAPVDNKATPSGNKYWGLVDPALLNPDQHTPTGGNAHDAMDAAAARPPDPWNQYLNVLGTAERFHDSLGLKAHPHTLCLRGTGYSTADVIEFQVQSETKQKSSYPKQGFKGYFTDANGKLMSGVLQNPSGEGDGTVVLSSAHALDVPGRPAPGDVSVKVKHQEAYEGSAVQTWAIQAVTTLCKLRYYEKHGPPAKSP